MQYGSPNSEQFLSVWSPRILRFFQLVTGVQELAETLTMETMVQHTRRGATPRDNGGVALLQLACGRARLISSSSRHSTDRLVRALAMLSNEQRIVAVLVGALSLNIRTVELITGIKQQELIGVCLRAFGNLDAALREESHSPTPSCRNDQGPTLGTGSTPRMNSS